MTETETNTTQASGALVTIDATTCFNAEAIAAARAAIVKAEADFADVIGVPVTAENAERAALAAKIIGARVRDCEKARRATDNAVDAVVLAALPGLAASRALLEDEKRAKTKADALRAGVKALEPVDPRRLFLATFLANDAEALKFAEKARGKLNARTGKMDPEMVGEYCYHDITDKQWARINKILNEGYTPIKDLV